MGAQRSGLQQHRTLRDLEVKGVAGYIYICTYIFNLSLLPQTCASGLWTCAPGTDNRLHTPSDKL